MGSKNGRAYIKTKKAGKIEEEKMKGFNKELKKFIAYILIFAMTVIQASSLTAVKALADSLNGPAGEVAEAYIGSVSYNTLADAINASKAGDVVKLNKDVMLKESFDASEYTISENTIIDINDNNVFFDDFTLKVADNAELTFTDSNKNSKLFGYFTNVDFYTISENKPQDITEYTEFDGGALTVLEGEKEAKGTIYVDGGKLTLDNVNVLKNFYQNDNVTVNNVTISANSTANIALNKSKVAIGEGVFIKSSADDNFNGNVSINDSAVTGFSSHISNSFLSCFYDGNVLMPGFKGNKLTINNTKFYNNMNMAPMWIRSNEKLEFTGCSVSNNSTYNSDVQFIDAFMYIMSDALIENCSYTNNKNAFLNICDTVSFNRLLSGYESVSNNEINITIKNCELRNNTINTTFGLDTIGLINCDEECFSHYINGLVLHKGYTGYNCNIVLDTYTVSNNNCEAFNFKSQKSLFIPGIIVHEHTPSALWSFNDTHHWHQCTDTECPDRYFPSKQADYCEHTMTYSKNDSDLSIAYCCNSDCGVSSNVIALKVPENAVYDGNAKSASVEGLDNWVNAGLAAPVLKYTSGNEIVEKAVDVGNYTAIMTVSENTVSANFAISKKTLSSENVSLSSDRFYYTGSYFSPVVTVKDGERTLTENVDYTVSGNIVERAFNAENETYKIYVSFIGNYEGNAVKEWSIVKYVRPEGFSVVFVDDDDIEVNEIEYKYTGKNITPKIRAYYNDKLLVEGVDYSIGYSNNINAVNADTKLSKQPYVKITGKNAYAKTFKKYFNITKVSLEETVHAENAKVKLKSSYKPIIMYNGLILKSTEYELSKTDSYKTEGTYTLTVKAKEKGNFTGSFQINVTTQNQKLNKFKVNIDTKTKYYYDGESKLPAYTVEDSKSRNTAPIYLTYGVDYLVSVPFESSEAGKYQLVFCGIGDYEGYITKNFTVNPYKLDIDKKKDVIISAGSTAYYSTSGAKLDNVVVNAVIKSGEDTKIFGLTEGKDYKISYSSNKQASTEKSKGKYTISFLGNYKGSKSAKSTFTVLRMPVSALNVVSVNKIGYTKDGVFKQKPEVEFINADGTNVIAKTSDYIVSYYLDPDCNVEMKGKDKLHIDDSENYGIVYAKITGKKNIENDSIVVPYKVYRKLDKKSSVTDMSKATINLVYPKDPNTGKDIKTIPQTGERITPEIKVTLGGSRNVIDSSEYTVSYINNTLKGTGKIIVTGVGSGKDSVAIGTKTKTFTISAMPLE